MAFSESERIGNSKTAPPGGSSELGPLLNQLPPSVKSVVKITAYSQIFNWWAWLGAMVTLGIMVPLGIVLEELTGRKEGDMGMAAIFGIGGFFLGMLVVGPLLGAWKMYQYRKRDRAWRTGKT